MPEYNAIQPDVSIALDFIDSCKNFPTQNALFVNGHFYTYSALLEKVEIVFDQLHTRKLPEFIGIYTRESVWTYAAILAISLSGACYVPLNAKLPDQKLQNIIKTSKLTLIISEIETPFSHQAFELIIEPKSKERQKTEILVQQDHAYLLFTSGTTGEPKGVPVSKKNCRAFFDHYKNNFDFNSSDKFLQPYELSFDVSVFCMFAAWGCGACLYVVPEEGFKYLNCMNMLKTYEITVSSMVPTVLQYLEKYLDEFSFPFLRYSFFSGDKLYQHLAIKWKHAAFNSEIYNCYGPTETTIVCTSYFWEEKKAQQESVNNIVPLGKPFEGMVYLIVDDTNSAVQNKIGELCFTGTQVIEAYLNQKYEDSFFMHEGKRYYKTGDLAELNGNGNLIFHGRQDTQVKINGFRVELAEIENAIFKLMQKNVVVLASAENNLEVLFAFIEHQRVDETALQKNLAELLPHYMIPAHYRFINAFPKNTNGKIDRKKLNQYIHEGRDLREN